MELNLVNEYGGIKERIRTELRAMNGYEGTI